MLAMFCDDIYIYILYSMRTHIILCILYAAYVYTYIYIYMYTIIHRVRCVISQLPTGGEPCSYGVALEC